MLIFVEAKHKSNALCLLRFLKPSLLTLLYLFWRLIDGNHYVVVLLSKSLIPKQEAKACQQIRA